MKARLFGRKLSIGGLKESLVERIEKIITQERNQLLLSFIILCACNAGKILLRRLGTASRAIRVVMPDLGNQVHQYHSDSPPRFEVRRAAFVYFSNDVPQRLTSLSCCSDRYSDAVFFGSLRSFLANIEKIAPVRTASANVAEFVTQT